MCRFLIGKQILYVRTFWLKMFGMFLSLILLGFTIITGIYEEYIMFIWWVFFWYPSMWGVIGLMGLMDKHPLFPNWNINVWRGAMVVGFMNIMLVLISFDTLNLFITSFGYTLSTSMMFLCAFWEGVLVWGLMDYFGTKYFWEGKSLLNNYKG